MIRSLLVASGGIITGLGEVAIRAKVSNIGVGGAGGVRSGRFSVGRGTGAGEGGSGELGSSVKSITCTFGSAVDLPCRSLHSLALRSRWVSGGP